LAIDTLAKSCYNNSMYKITSNGLTLNDCLSLDEAMTFAKTIGIFVTIVGPDFEVCGMFGVDSIKNGLCPDGVAYDWNKASRIGQMKR
jgi:hypothetical protein